MKLSTILKEKGYDVREILKQQGLSIDWDKWYRGKTSFHLYDVYNGENTIHCRKMSLGLPKMVCEDWAGLLLNENVKFQVGEDESKTQKLFDEVLDDNDFYTLANRGVEKTFARGTGAYVLSLHDMVYDTNTQLIDKSEAKLKIEFVSAMNIIPLSWDNQGKITDCAFVTTKTLRGRKTLCMSIHEKQENGFYTIFNYAYELRTNGAIGNEIEVSEALREFETRSPIPWFSIQKPNIVNNIDETSPYGLAIIANAIDSIKSLDNAYDSLNNEFVLGRKRIFVAAELLKPDMEKGSLKKSFDTKDIVFHTLPTMEGKELIKESDMNLRVEEHIKGVQIQLNIATVKLGLGKDFYNFDVNGIYKNQLAVVSENSDLYRNIKKHEIEIENCLYDLFRAILFIMKEHLGKPVDTEAEIKIEFDDSIVEDKNSTVERGLNLYEKGTISLFKFLTDYLGLTEENANTEIARINEEKKTTTMNDVDFLGLGVGNNDTGGEEQPSGTSQ